MQICKPHWDQVKSALKERGLSKDVEVEGHGSASTRPWKLDTQEPQTDSTHDPLLAANNLIWLQAEQKLGAYLIRGSYCPLCEAEKNIGQGQATEWITDCADSVLDQYRKSQRKE